MTPQTQRCQIALRALATLPTPLLDDVRATVEDVFAWDRALCGGVGISAGEKFLLRWLADKVWPGSFECRHDLGDVLERLAVSGDIEGVKLWYCVASEIRAVSLHEAIGAVA